MKVSGTFFSFPLLCFPVGCCCHKRFPCSKCDIDYPFLLFQIAVGMDRSRVNGETHEMPLKTCPAECSTSNLTSSSELGLGFPSLSRLHSSYLEGLREAGKKWPMGSQIDGEPPDRDLARKFRREDDGGGTWAWKPSCPQSFPGASSSLSGKSKDVVRVMSKLEASVNAERSLPEYRRSILQQRRGYPDVRGDALLRALKLSLPEPTEEA